MEQKYEKVLPMRSLVFSFYKQHVIVFFFFPLVFSSPVFFKSMDSGRMRYMVGHITATLSLYIQIQCNFS